MGCVNIYVAGYPAHRLAPNKSRRRLHDPIQMGFAIQSENPVVKAVIEGTAPRPARLAAARGVLPLPQHDLLEVLVALATGDDTELSGYARDTIRTQDEESLKTVVSSDDAPIPVLNYLATIGELPQKVHESIIRNSRTPMTTIARFAGETADGEP